MTAYQVFAYTLIPLILVVGTYYSVFVLTTLAHYVFGLTLNPNGVIGKFAGAVYGDSYITALTMWHPIRWAFGFLASVLWVISAAIRIVLGLLAVVALVIARITFFVASLQNDIVSATIIQLRDRPWGFGGLTESALSSQKAMQIHTQKLMKAYLKQLRKAWGKTSRDAEFNDQYMRHTLSLIMNELLIVYSNNMSLQQYLNAKQSRNSVLRVVKAAYQNKVGVDINAMVEPYRAAAMPTSKEVQQALKHIKLEPEVSDDDEDSDE